VPPEHIKWEKVFLRKIKTLILKNKQTKKKCSVTINTSHTSGSSSHSSKEREISCEKEWGRIRLWRKQASG
jgi:hypothetical protein